MITWKRCGTQAPGIGLEYYQSYSGCRPLAHCVAQVLTCKTYMHMYGPSNMETFSTKRRDLLCGCGKPGYEASGDLHPGKM